MSTPISKFFSPSYQAKLHDPRWHSFAYDARKRLGNCCHICRRKDLPIQVHHIVYTPDKEPWEVPEGDVMLLCEHCHRSMHEELNKFRRYVFAHLKPQTFKILNSALVVALDQYNDLIFVHALSEFVSNRRLVENHAKAWGVEDVKK